VPKRMTPFQRSPHDDVIGFARQAKEGARRAVGSLRVPRGVSLIRPCQDAYRFLAGAHAMAGMADQVEIGVSGRSGPRRSWDLNSALIRIRRAEDLFFNRCLGWKPPWKPVRGGPAPLPWRLSAG